MKREGPSQLSNQLNPFHLAVRAEWSIDDPFELRTQSKKEKRRSCRPFPGHFADHFRSSCRFPVFRPCFCSPPVPRQIGSSIYRQIGLTNISVSDVMSGWIFCHRVSGPVDRHTHRDHLGFLFDLPKDVGNRHQLRNQINWNNRHIRFWIKGESPGLFRYVGFHCHPQYYVLRERERELMQSLSVDFPERKEKKIQMKTKETKMSSTVWWIV
jgi:hypothetical protein